MTNSSTDHYDVIIIGAGFSGVATAFHLFKERAGSTVNLTGALIDPGDRIGAGIAYGTESPVHTLNVPASKMGIDEQDPGGFYSWLVQHSPGPSPEDYVPRHLYQRYLSAELERVSKQSPPGVALEKVTDVVRSISRAGDTDFRVVTAQGRELRSKNIVIAVGNSPAAQPRLEPGLSSPWDRQAITQGSASEAVAIIGSGLTAVDTIMALEAAGFRGTYTLISRKGQLPQPHSVSVTGAESLQVTIEQIRSTRSLRKIVRTFRRATASGAAWADLIDALRPYSQALWSEFSEREKRRFIRHLRPYWDSHRHRAPPASVQLIRDLTAQQRLKLLRGRVLSVAVIAGRTQLHFSGGGLENLEPFDYCFDCRGLWSDLGRCESPLISSLISEGFASFDELRLGLRADAGGELIRSNGQVVAGLFTLGSLRRGELWETTAVREIRQQAGMIARVISSRIGA